MKMKQKWLALVLGCGMVLALIVTAQEQEIRPRQSPYAEVLQRVGVTDVQITYHRPGVKGRTIWGDLVPYDSEKPWRAGANNATTFSVTNDVKINGHPLEAGHYTFYVDVNEDEWVLIFSNIQEAWGSFNYTSDQDALRVSVKPQEAPHQEWLRYGFEDLSQSSAVGFLHWEKLKAAFTIEEA